MLFDASFKIFFAYPSIWKQDVDGIDQNDSDLEKDPAPSANFRTKY